jgi:hypothetical protein
MRTFRAELPKSQRCFLHCKKKILSESVKSGIRAQLILPRLGEIQAAGNLTKVEAIEAAKKTICTMSQQGQDEYKTDAAMIDVLERHALLNETWSATSPRDERLRLSPLTVTAQH